MTDSVRTFTENAERVAAKVHPVTSMDQALEKAVALCLEKPRLTPQVTADLDPETRVLAAPGLDDGAFSTLSGFCEKAGITLIRENLRQYPQGIDMGLTPADFGIADTGTLVLDSSSEENRLATMLCEWHAAVLKASTIRESALAMETELKDLTRNAGAYTAFVTGPSRTADIERVLALGVHGPLELHIILVED